MSKVPIIDIKYKLRCLYPTYKFEVKHNPNEDLYYFTVFKNGYELGELTFAPETSMDDLWDTIREWMRGIIKKVK
jgi:hypothetical protein